MVERGVLAWVGSSLEGGITCGGVAHVRRFLLAIDSHSTAGSAGPAPAVECGQQVAGPASR